MGGGDFTEQEDEIPETDSIVIELKGVSVVASAAGTSLGETETEREESFESSDVEVEVDSIVTTLAVEISELLESVEVSELFRENGARCSETAGDLQDLRKSV